MVDFDNPFFLRRHKPGYPALARRVPVCDFCDEPEPVGYFRIPRGRVDLGNCMGAPVIDNGEWNACQECRDLIRAGDWTELEVRGVSCMQLKFRGVPNHEVRAHTVRRYAQFRQHWRGDYVEERPA